VKSKEPKPKRPSISERLSWYPNGVEIDEQVKELLAEAAADSKHRVIDQLERTNVVIAELRAILNQE
jgi:hypothetical protein